MTATFLKIDEAAFTVVYGLTVLERSVHALERGGVKSVYLPKDKEAQASKALRKNQNWTIEIHYVNQPFREVFSKNEQVLLLAQPLVIDQKIVAQLLENEQAGQKILTTPNHQVALFPSATDLFPQAIPDTIPDCISQAEKAGLKVEKVDFPGLLCTPVPDASTKKQVKKALIRSLTKPTDGWVSRNLNRPISTLVSRVLAHTSVTPNQFTIVTGLIGLLCGYFLAMGGYWNWLIGGALFHLTSVFDGVDGELARLKFKSSPFGQWLDTLVDNLSYLVGLGGIIIGIYRMGASDAVKIAGLLAVVFAVLALASLYFYLLRFKSGGTLLNVEYSFQGGTSFWDKAFQVGAAFGKRDLFALIFFGLGIIGQMPMALAYVAIMAFFVFLFSIQAHITASKKRANS